MKKQKSKSRPLDETAYVRVMLPHVATEEAKKIGLEDRQGKEWKSLVKRVRKTIEDRYERHRYTNSGLLYRDMTYERSNSNCQFKKEKPSARKKQNKPIATASTSNLENDMLVDMVVGATKLQKEWIRGTRMKLLNKLRNDEVEVSVYLNSKDIEAYNKVPFMVDGVPFFADIYLPEFNIIIDITNKFKREIDGGRWIKDRYRKIKKTGCFLIDFDVASLKNKNFLHDLTYKLLVSRMKQKEI